MRKLYLLVMTLMFGVSVMAQQSIQLRSAGSTTFAQSQTKPQWTRILSDQPETFRTQLISSTENSIKVNIQVPGFYTIDVTTPKGEAKIISMPKAVSTAEAGEPNMPMTGIPAIIGDQARMNIRVLDAQYMDFEGIEVAPSKGEFPRTIDPATVPYTYGECYRQDAFFPANNVGLYEPYIVRDFRGQNMVVYPYTYNPVTKTLRVYYNMTVEMYKVDDHGVNTMQTNRSGAIKMDPDFKSMYQRQFINYQAAMNRYTPVDEEGDLLIICYDNFISSMTDFVNWKKTRGINTTIVGTSTAGSTSSDLKTYIQDQYNANNNLTHVLLVGDVAQIPGYSYSGASGYTGLGDNPYGQVAGNDIYNDIFIGRFSASSADQVTTQVNRTITYERDLTTNATWCQNGLGISTTAGNGGHYNEDDYQHIENLRTDLLSYGYTTVYQDYKNVSGYPSSTTTTISDHINSGVGIINYCNHGSQTSWQSHNYSNYHVNALTNDNKLPFIFSVACLVGKYDYSSGDCFAETWMHATNSNTPTGAIGGAFSYISQPWVPPMWAQDEFVDILMESYSNNIKRTFGGAAVNGMMAIFDNYSTTSAAAVGTYQAWVVFGDPTLMMRTKTPQAMTVTHSGILPLGTSSYSLTVNDGSGAVATITDADHNILGKATVSDNSATINITNGNLTPNQELTLCVFGYNKVTYLGTITVTDCPYDITVTQPQHGTISAPAQAYADATVTLTATPDEGYELGNWLVYKTDDANTTVTVNNNNFTMPNYPVTVSANFFNVFTLEIEPYTNGGGWQLIASPVVEDITPSASNGFITDDGTDPENLTYDLYYFDQTGGGENGNGLEWKNYRANNFDIVNGKGYLYASKNGTTLSFTGTPYSGDGQVSLLYSDTYTHENMRGWNLIGNPFGEAAYLTDTTGKNLSFYRMNDDGDAFIAVVTGTIKCMEGILVHTTSSGQNIKFTTEAPSNPGKGNLCINLAQAVTNRSTKPALDNAIIRFDNGNTLEKLSFREGSSKVYIPQDNKDYAVVNAENQGEIPINFKAEENGTYTLSFSAEEVTFSYLHLIDNLTGNDVDLLAAKVPEPAVAEPGRSVEGPTLNDGVSTSSTTSYTFTAKTTDYESRFKLIFSVNGEDGPSTPSTGSETGSGTFAFYNNGNIIINGTGTLQVIDMMGRKLYSREVAHSTFSIPHSAFTPGVYVLRLINGNDVKTQKIIIE